MMNQILRDSVQLFREAWSFFQDWWMWFALLLADGILIMLLMKSSGMDAQIARVIALPESSTWWPLARQISFWGDWPTGTLLGCVGAWMVAYVKNSHRWQVIALACLLGSASAGIAANCLRITTGRPRPHVQKEDGFYGPLAVVKFEPKEGTLWEKMHHYANSANRYQSFPSGHAATSVGAGVAVAVICPTIGIPLCVGSGAVCWSRMALHRHYPGDVIVGVFFGLIGGLCFGMAGRRMLASRLRRPGVIEPEIVR